MAELTKADVLEVAGLTRQEFENWTERGVVTPAAGGEGKGDPRRFTVPPVVGLSVAAGLRKGGLGCALPFAAKVAAFLGAMSEADLLREFEAGRTRLIPDDPPQLIEPRYWRTTRAEFDVTAAYGRVAAYLGRAGRRPPAGAARREGFNVETG
jgi:hypothetical protein